MKEKPLYNVAERKILERLFEADINDKLPLQIKSKYIPGLQEKGLITTYKRYIGSDKFGDIFVEGWQLTLIGHFLICEYYSELHEKEGCDEWCGCEKL